MIKSQAPSSFQQAAYSWISISAVVLHIRIYVWCQKRHNLTLAGTRKHMNVHQGDHLVCPPDYRSEAGYLEAYK